MPPKALKKFQEICSEIRDIEEENPEEYVKHVLRNINSAQKKELTEAESMAINVANLLIPMLGSIIRKSKPVKVEAAVRVIAYRLDELEQYSRRENIRITGLKEEEHEDLKMKVI